MHLRASTLDDLLRQLYAELMEHGAPIEASRGANTEIIGFNWNWMRRGPG